MKLLISRHGKSRKKVNEKGFPEILGGSYDFDRELAEKGIDQAEDLGRLMKVKEIDAAYSSELTRAVQTASVAIGVCGQVSYVTPDKRLNERNFGKLSGEFSDEFVLRDDIIPCLDQEALEDYLGIPNHFALFKEYLKHVLYEVNPPNIDATTIITINSKFPEEFKSESAEDIAKRINSFEDYLLDRYNPDNNIAVFCHGDVMRCWLAKVERQPERYSQETLERVKAIPNKGIYRKISNCSLFDIAFE